MKLTKRLLAMLLLVCMVFSMLPAIALTASAADAKTLSFSFSSSISGWPATNSTALKNYTYSLSGTSYTFALKNVKCNSTYLMLTSTAVLGLPAIDGFKLTKVVATGNKGASTKTKVSITSNTTGTAISGGAAQTWSTAGATYTYNLSGTSANTMYYMYVTTANAQVTNLVLTYESTAPAYTLTASSNGHGTVGTPSNGTVICAPDDGYYLSGASVTADCGLTVSYSGNTITYTGTQTADAVITANFTEKQQYTVTFVDKGATVDTASVYGGDTPESVPTLTAPEGFKFVGWTTDSSYTSSETVPTLTDPLTTAVNAATTYYAVYAELDGEGNPDKLRLATDLNELTDGTQVAIVTGTTALKSDSIGATTVTVDSDNKISNSNSYIWKVSKNGNSYTFTNGNGVTLGVSSLLTQTSLSLTSSNNTWNISGENGAFNIKVANDNAKAIQYYNSKWQIYNATNASTIKFYIPDATIEGYTTNPVITTIKVTWVNGTEIFDSGKVAFGDPIVAPAEKPVKTDEGQQYFIFAGWSEAEDGAVITDFPTASATLGDKTYYAVYNTVSKLTVTWNNYDNSTLATEYYKSGETPSYKGSEPTKPADPSYYYTFSGWNPTVSPVSAAITYTATFAQHDRFELTASLAKNTVKADRSTQINYTLTDQGTATTAFTPVFSVADPAIASVNENGRVSALAVGSTTVTITFPGAFDAQGNPLTKTLNLTVIENISNGGYTLITQDNVPEDWSGDYIIMGKTGGDTTYMNTWMLLTPNYDGGSVKIAKNSEDAATITITDDGSGIGTGTINDEGNASSGVDKAIVMEDTGLVTDTNGDDSILVYDTITEIDDGYAFTIECIDDVNQIYTIRVKDTNLYIACAETGVTTNSLNFDANATEYAQWQFSVQRVTKGGYNNDIIVAQNIGNNERCLYFNSNGYGLTTGQFRDYRNNSTDSHIGGDTTGGGLTYNLYLFGNPNPFKAQIYYHGDQITLVDTGKVNANAQTAQLTGALTPDIDNYPNWTQVGDPAWEIVENSNGNHMTIDSATGLVTTNSSTVGSYALVKITYTVHDEVNNVDKLVSTISKVEVIDADTTYSTVIYELYSGEDTEVQYTVPNSMSELPLAAYVVNDTTDDNSKTGNVVMGGTLNWSITSTSTSMFGTFSIDANGVLHMSNVTKDSIVTVKVTGATGDNMAATAATYKIYVKTADYTLNIVPTNGSQGSYDTDSDVLTVAGNENSAKLTYNVVDDNGNGPSATTFTLAGGAWTISGESYGALINSNGVLDFSKVDRSEDRTITAVVSRVAATDATTGTIKSGLTDTITIVIKAKTVEEKLDAIDDTVIIDWALPVTFNVLKNDNYNVEVSVAAGSLPAGVASNGDGSFTYTPSGWQTADQTFTYTLSGTVGGAPAADEATVNLKTADSIYYEDTYSGIFSFTGNWSDVKDGTLVAEQTSSLDTADIFEFDANHEDYAKYSGGTAKMTTLSKGVSAGVSFTFAGTGFDVISATNNNAGAFMLTVKDSNGAVVNDPATGMKLSKIMDIFRGYTYTAEGYTRYGLVKVNRCDASAKSDPAGSFYVDSTTKEIIPCNIWYNVDPTQVDDLDYYDDAQAFDRYQDASGSYAVKEFTSNWLPYDQAGKEADTYNNNYFQIPVIRVMGLPYGTYTVTLKPTYSMAYDRQGDGSYDFYFDGVRIHNPVADRAAEYKYISIHNAVKAGEGFGSGKVVACDHQGHEWSDWTFYSPARNTTSATTTNRGSFVQYCSFCGGIANTAYFHVAVAADNTELGVGGYRGLPSTTMLRYTLTADDCGDATVQASIQTKLDSIRGTLTEYWSSNSRDVMTCMNNSNVVIGNGNGTTYATLQLKDPATQTIYASAIHSPMITVYEDETHEHTFGDWTHDADSDPSTHTHTCTGADCSFYETEECVLVENVTKEPTQTETGTKTYSCSVCGYSYEEEIPALGGFTATFHVPEGATAPAALTGNSVTMPTAVAAPADYDAHSYTFVGWVESTVSDTATEQSFYAPGYEFELNEDMDFYALYTYGVAGGGSGWTKVSDLSTISGGTVILINENGYAFNGSISSGHGQGTSDAFSFTNGSAATAPTGAVELTLIPSGDGFKMYNEDYGYLYASKAASGGLAWHNSESSFWSYVNDNWVYASNSARLRVYQNSFRTYDKNSNDSLFMAVQGGIEDYFTTELAKACTHENTTTTTTAATCTAAGSTVVTCDDCHKTISTTHIPALGHYLDAGTVTTAATCTADGVLTKSCTREGCTYTETEAIPALGHSYTYTDNGDDATHSISCSVCHFNGGNENHTWSGDECSKCGAEKPSTPTPVAGYSLSTSAPAAGDQVIIARLVSGTYYAMTNSSTPNSSALTIVNGVVSSPASSVIWTVESASGGVYLKSGSNYLHMNSSALKVAGDKTNGIVNFISNGDGSFKGERGDGSRWIVTSGTNSFTCSSTKANAAALYIFKYSDGTKSAAKSIAPASTAKRNIPTGNFNGAVIIDGKGTANTFDDFAAYGPNNEVYLAPGQGIVFSLTSDKDITTQDLQIGAKAVNGTATQMDVASISNGTVSTGIKYLLENKAIASATEMYYELDGSQVGWSNGESSVIVIYNSGSGVLSLTNLRYSTANNNTLTMNINEVQTQKAAKMLRVVYGTAVTLGDPNATEPVVTPSDITPSDITPSNIPTEPISPSSDPTEPTGDPTEPSSEPTKPTKPVDVNSFTDLDKTAWYMDGVKYAIDNGLMKGVSDTEFAPQRTVTRAMLVTILHRLVGEPKDPDAKIAFTDVKSDAWYYDAVVWAVKNDVTKGTSATTFSPNAPVTREQLVTFLWRFAGEPDSSTDLSAFVDNADVSAFASVAMQWAVENKIVTGKPGNKIDPKGNATRAEIAVIFMRAEKTIARPE